MGVSELIVEVGSPCIKDIIIIIDICIIISHHLHLYPCIIAVGVSELIVEVKRPCIKYIIIIAISSRICIIAVGVSELIVEVGQTQAAAATGIDIYEYNAPSNIVFCR